MRFVIHSDMFKKNSIVGSVWVGRHALLYTWHVVNRETQIDR